MTSAVPAGAAVQPSRGREQDKKGRYPLARKKQNTERSPEHGRKAEGKKTLVTKNFFSFCGHDE
jgi:hypothetical protein